MWVFAVYSLLWWIIVEFPKHDSTNFFSLCVFSCLQYTSDPTRLRVCASWLCLRVFVAQLSWFRSSLIRSLLAQYYTGGGICPRLSHQLSRYCVICYMRWLYLSQFLELCCHVLIISGMDDVHADERPNARMKGKVTSVRETGWAE